VFTYLIESLGTQNVQFEELISLDSESLQQLNPIGVIFLFKYPTGEKQQKDKPQDGEFDFAAVDAQGEENVWFAAQTIQNACGTQALLSVLLNKDGSSEDGKIDIGPNLREFKEFTSGFPADVCWKSTICDHLMKFANTLCIASWRGSIELRPHSRHPQLVRTQLTIRERRNPHGNRGRRRLPLHRIYLDQRHTLRD
jgi:hypothetical protein